ncbi:MAG TPA: hypothetical protein VF605_16120 [Allosphingosinicella sp.]|jgi:hypothetical protein
MAHRKKIAGKWRKKFLSALARTANARLAAAMAGVDHSTAYGLRKRDSAFAAAWLRARAWGRERVKAEGRPAFPGGRPRPARAGEAPPDPRALVVRQRKGGGAEVVRVGEGRWSPESEEVFFGWLGAGWGVRRAAREAGFSTNALYARRRLHADFAARWDEARSDSLERNDLLLIDSVQWSLDPGAVEAAENLPRPSISEAIRIRRLYRPPAGAAAGRPARSAEPPKRDLNELLDVIRARLEEIELEQAQEKLDSGWVQDETGYWIPPGWVRAAA